MECLILVGGNVSMRMMGEALMTLAILVFTVGRVGRKASGPA